MIYCLEGSLQRSSRGPNNGELHHVQIECILMSHEFFFRKEKGVFILKYLLFFIYLFFIAYVLNDPKIIKLFKEKKNFEIFKIKKKKKKKKGM